MAALFRAEPIEKEGQVVGGGTRGELHQEVVADHEGATFQRVATGDGIPAPDLLGADERIFPAAVLQQAGLFVEALGVRRGGAFVEHATTGQQVGVRRFGGGGGGRPGGRRSDGRFLLANGRRLRRGNRLGGGTRGRDLGNFRCVLAQNPNENETEQQEDKRGTNSLHDASYAACPRASGQGDNRLVRQN